MSHLLDSSTNAELDTFLSRADKIHAAVTGLAAGTIEAEDTEDLLEEITSKKSNASVDPHLLAYRAEQAAKVAAELVKKGKPGQGLREGYELFCRACFREFEAGVTLEVEKETKKMKCGNCSSSTSIITRSERLAEIHSKVETLTEMKKERHARRVRYQEWKKEKEKQEEGTNVVVKGNVTVEEVDNAKTKKQPASSALSYTSWDLWEPSSDEELDSAPPANDPQFAAMKADMEAREQKKATQRIISEAANERGNKYVKQKEYLAAIEEYTVAINATRSEKSYYTNRALCYIHTFSYQLGIKDCETAINLFECFEQGTRRYETDYKNMKTVLKAWMRKSKAEVELKMWEEARKSMQSAVTLIQQIYSVSSDRKSPEYQKAQREELKAIEALKKECEEKEKYAKEEEKVKERVEKVEETKENEQQSAVSEARITTVSTSLPSSSSSSTAITSLLSALTLCHQQLLSDTLPSSSTSPTASPLTIISLLPALRFLQLTLDGADGNKEKVCGGVASRVCVEVLVKIVKLGLVDASTTTTSIVNVTLPSFTSITPYLSRSNSAYQHNLITFREQGGFAILGKLLNQAVGKLTGENSKMTPEVREVIVSILAGLTDRESGRALLSSATNAPVLTQLALTVLSTSKNAEEKLNTSNLLANLAYQPTYRTWIVSAGSTDATPLLEQLYRQIMLQTKGVSGTTNENVLASGLSVIINLLTLQTCRTRFVSTGTTSPDTPLSLLLTSLHSVITNWSTRQYKLSPSVSELSEKLLSIVMNLAVDPEGNARIFEVLNESGKLADVIVGLLKLVAQPNLSTDATKMTVSSILSPLLVERALGVITRGVRREHQVATAVPSKAAASSVSSSTPKPSQPIRQFLLDNNAVDTFLSILAFHSHVPEDDSVSAESVLASLQSSTSEASSTSSASKSPSSSFQYTRLTLDHASVCLTVCMAQQNTPAITRVSQFKFGASTTGISILVSLLSSKSKNVAGNACLCIDALCSVPSLLVRPELSAALDKLLTILKDPSCKAAHSNAAKAAILIGRAPNNTERWTQMRGVEIISAVLKMK